MKDLNLDTLALYRNGILILLLVSIALIVHNVFSQNGYLALRRQRKELQSLHEKIDKLKQENDALDKGNRALKSDPAAIERLAREQMHLAKPGEKIYTLPEQAPANSSAPSTNATSPQP
jgi:cell division protein FtsL